MIDIRCLLDKSSLRSVKFHKSIFLTGYRHELLIIPDKTNQQDKHNTKFNELML